MGYALFRCGDCGERFSVEQDYCDECTGEPHWPDLLAANLAIGGALCEAWGDGLQSQLDYTLYRAPWEPGCRRSAP